MEQNLLDALSPRLWSRLPHEILVNIVHQTTDNETLSRWCEATQGSQAMHQIAMKARWQTVIIDDRDLLPAQGDDEKKFNKIQRKLKREGLGQHWKPVGEMVHLLLRTTNKSDQCPARYVRNLVLDLRMLRYWKDIYGHGLNAHDLMPSLKTLEHTLTMLKGQFHNIRCISCLGDTPQAILDFIASDASSAFELEIRSLGAYGRLQIDLEDEPTSFRNPTRRWPLQWEGLSTLHQLRSLDIHHLSNLEITGLLSVLPRLTRLHHLILACEDREHGSGHGGCSLQNLLHQVFDIPTDTKEESVAENLDWLPRNLVSLSLIDTSSSDRPVKPQGVQSLSLSSRLVHITIDLANVGWVPMIVDGLPELTLRVLSIPGSSLNRQGPTQSDHAYLDGCIMKHQQSLGRIQLLRAWNTDRGWIERINDHWHGAYAIQELVLGTRNPAWYHGFPGQWREIIPKPTLMTYLCGFEWDNQPCCERWGRELKRIRIDHLDIHDLDTSVLSELCYSHVKILMLQPRSHAPQNHCGEEVMDGSVCNELAEHILLHAQASLRIIVIGAHKYWINRDLCGHDRVLWTWADARESPVQNKSMLSTLDKADLEFLNCTRVPLWFERNVIEWHQNRSSQTSPYKPSNEMLHQWNYLTLSPLPQDMARH